MIIEKSPFYNKKIDVGRENSENYNCKKCGLTISSTCSKCDKVVDVEVLDDGCIVQKTKCGDCANTPVIKDVCAQQK